jgi:hypothetical protein
MFLLPNTNSNPKTKIKNKYLVIMQCAPVHNVALEHKNLLATNIFFSDISLVCRVLA